MGYSVAVVVFLFSFISYRGNFKTPNVQDREMEEKWSKGRRKIGVFVGVCLVSTVFIFFYHMVATHIELWHHAFRYLAYAMMFYSAVNILVLLVKLIRKQDLTPKRGVRRYILPLLNMLLVTIFLSYIWVH